MKTTLNLPDDLMRDVKIHAARNNRKLQDVIAELLRRGLAQTSDGVGPTRRRVQLPLISGGHAASSEEEMTPYRVAQILTDQEALEALR